MLSKDFRNIFHTDARIRTHGELQLPVSSLYLCYIQLMGQNPEQGDAQQVIHRFGHLSEPVKQFFLHILALGMGFHTGDPLVNIQLLLLVHNIGRRDKGIRLQLHGCSEVHNALFPLKVLHRFIEHLTVKIIPNGLHMAMLLAAQEISGPPDFQIPHGDFKPAAQIREFPDG